MQSAAYHSIARWTAVNGIATRRPSRPRFLRTVARQWDLIGVISLMLSSGAYGLYALLYVAR